MISFRLSISNQAQKGDIEWDYIPSWSHNLPEDATLHYLRAHIYQCKELPSADDNGTSDPYIEVWSPTDYQHKTWTIHDNNNPIYFQTVEVPYYTIDRDYAPPFILNIFDEDSNIFDSDDFQGRAVIKMDQAEVGGGSDSPPLPKWHPIRMGFDEAETAKGQILVSFNLSDPGAQFRTLLKDINLAPNMDEYRVEINVLGLRSLESEGLLPVKKPFIKFNLKSLLPPSKSQAIDNIKTQPNFPGANPTISTVIKFNIKLPSDPLYCPSLTVILHLTFSAVSMIKSSKDSVNLSLVTSLFLLGSFFSEIFRNLLMRTEKLLTSLST